MKNDNQPKYHSTVSINARLFIFIMVASMLSSCTAVIQAPTSTEIVADVSPMVEETAIVTEVLTETLILDPTATVTSDPLEIAEEQEKNMEEIVENIREFLASQGKFSFEEIKKSSQYFYEESEFRDGKLPLGMITDWHGQFILLGHIYDENSKYMHLFLGGIDAENNRVIIEFNFKRHFEDENNLFGVKIPLCQTKSSPASSIASENQDNMKLIYTEKEWNAFVEEAMFKPITLFWGLESREKYFADRGHPKVDRGIDYDLALNFRRAIFNRVPKFGDALRSLRTPPSIDNKTEADNLICFWTEESFKGIESLNTQCPSANQIVDIAIR